MFLSLPRPTCQNAVLFIKDTRYSDHRGKQFTSGMRVFLLLEGFLFLLLNIAEMQKVPDLKQ